MNNLSMRIGLPVLALLSLLFSGCYYDRLTGRYDDVPDVEEDSAIIAKNELSPQELKKRHDFLVKLSQEPQPGYTVNSGDRFEIKVYNQPDLSVTTVVTPDGYIGLVLVGEIKVAGLTLEQAAAKIEKSFSRYLRNPKVGLSPISIESEYVTISGSVNKPGIYPIFEGMRVADLFAKAEGSATRLLDGQTFDAADFENSLFIRDHQVIPIDFIKAIKQDDPLHNILLRRGDYIFVAARANSMVYLIGEVKKPGQKLWSSDLGLLELLSVSGWVDDNRWSHVIIIRGGLSRPRMYKVDLDAILCGKARNVALKAGDIVYVPKDNMAEYNVFVRKLMPTAQLLNMIFTPATWWTSQI